MNAPSEKIMFLWAVLPSFASVPMVETQVLMAVPDFSGFFSRDYFLEGSFVFQWEEFLFLLRGVGGIHF